MSAKLSGTVFISGKFAVIHSGHIRLFVFAKTLGSKLIVALDTEGLDESEIEWRVGFLKSQEFVDEVIIYKSDVAEIILKLKPNYVLKGSEFATQFNMEQEVVSNYGGELVFSSGSTYFSETDLLNKKNDLALSVTKELPKDYLKRNKIDVKKIAEQISAFEKVRVCVIGDLIVDEYINCHPLGMSREEPTVVVTPIDSQKFLGGAGIVAAHTVGLGAKTTLISILGPDEAGSWSLKKANEYGITFQAIEDKKRPTTLKQRYRSGTHTLLKISHLSQDEVAKEIQNKIVKAFELVAQDVDLLILSDFSYGTFTASTAESLIAIAKTHGIVISADSQTSSQLGNLTQFLNVDLITPTEVEARLELKDQSSGLAIIAEKLRQKILSRSMLIKLGADGVLLHGTDPQGNVLTMDALPSFNLNPVDTSGAGDSLLAASSLALAVEHNLPKAALIGSLAAAIQISRVGNVPIQREQLTAIIMK